MDARITDYSQLHCKICAAGSLSINTASPVKSLFFLFLLPKAHTGASLVHSICTELRCRLGVYQTIRKSAMGFATCNYMEEKQQRSRVSKADDRLGMTKGWPDRFFIHLGIVCPGSFYRHILYLGSSAFLLISPVDLIVRFRP